MPGKAGALSRALANQELLALTSVAHPAVSRVIEAGELPGGIPFIATEFVEGATLRQIIRQGKVAPRKAASILVEISNALAVPHQTGVFHLDIKPENIIVHESAESGTHATLIDFGSAWVVSSRALRLRTGSKAYMAPEWIAGYPGAGSDVFAMGLVGFEMLTGTLPDQESGPPAIIEALQGLASPELSCVIARAMDPNPRNRYASAGELKAALIEAGACDGSAFVN